jgi:hypothetical protein
MQISKKVQMSYNIAFYPDKYTIVCFIHYAAFALSQKIPVKKVPFPLNESVDTSRSNCKEITKKITKNECVYSEVCTYRLLKSLTPSSPFK